MTDFPKELLDGYQEFRSGDFLEQKQRFQDLAEAGQKPHTMIIGCCDSRSAPETIFNANPGDIFVVRNVANMVPPNESDHGFHSTSAALEFAVQALKVRNVLVLGHSKCGGIGAALNPSMKPLSADNFIGKWMELLKPTAASIILKDGLSATERQTALEQMSVRKSIDNLRTFPFIADLEESGELALHGAWFDISLGELWAMNSETGEFIPAGAAKVSP